VTVTAGAIKTTGDGAVGIFAQSVGGGGGIVEGEVAARKGAVRQLGLVQVHVRFDPALVHKPAGYLGRAVASIGDQA
jgi:hypothetical protein